MQRRGGIPSFLDGNKLLALCEGDRAVPTDCIIYIEGVADEWRFVNYLTEPDKPVCAADARGNEIREAVVNYLKAHPENRNDPAAALIQQGHYGGVALRRGCAALKTSRASGPSGSERECFELPGRHDEAA